MEAEQTTAVIPWTGQILDLAQPKDAAFGFRESIDFYWKLKAFQEACRETLRAEADRRGERAFDMDGLHVEVANPSDEITYDIDKLHLLVEAGLPVERWSKLVTYEPKVDGRVIQQLRRANAEYAAIIDHATQAKKPKARTVKVVR